MAPLKSAFKFRQQACFSLFSAAHTSTWHFEMALLTAQDGWSHLCELWALEVLLAKACLEVMELLWSALSDVWFSKNTRKVVSWPATMGTVRVPNHKFLQGCCPNTYFTMSHSRELRLPLCRATPFNFCNMACYNMIIIILAPDLLPHI